MFVCAQKKMSARTDRVKSLDIHPAEPWLLVSLYSGRVLVYNTETQVVVKSFDVVELPVRCSKFIPRKQWIVACSDDMHIRVWNYNTMEKVHTFEAHTDYIRYLEVHPTKPYLLSCADDMTVRCVAAHRHIRNARMRALHPRWRRLLMVRVHVRAHGPRADQAVELGEELGM